MRRYIKADLIRIMTKKSRLIICMIFLFLAEVFLWPDAAKDTPVAIISSFGMFIKVMPIIIGLYEILRVFGDDFKGKTAQIAIGIGVSRHKVIFAKWLEMIILYTLDTLIILGLHFIICFVFGIVFTPAMLGEAVIFYLVSVITLAAYVAILLPILFASQGVTLAVIFYLLTASTGVARLIKFLGGLPFLMKWHPYSYTLDNCLNLVRTRAILGALNPTAITGVLLYIIIGIGIAIFIYQRTELEF